MGTDYFVVTKGEDGEWTIGDWVVSNSVNPLAGIMEIPCKEDYDALVGEGNLMLPDDWFDAWDDFDLFCDAYAAHYPKRVGTYFQQGKYPELPAMMQLLGRTLLQSTRPITFEECDWAEEE